MRYRFYQRSDEQLIEVSDSPVSGGIALSLRSTGYDADEDEVVELAIVDLDGKTLFSRTVKPQNKDAWDACEASGGLSPLDVADEPELYQFEEEISALFENASIVVAPYVEYAESMIESSWISLPPYEPFDLIGQFCASHSAEDYPNEPAAVASLSDIAAYYGLPQEPSDLVEAANVVAQCYVKLVEEHAQERSAKGAAYWEGYERRKLQEQEGDRQAQEAKRLQEMKATRINAILWLCGAAVFSNLAVQLNMRGVSFDVVAIVAAVAVFLAVRWVMCLYGLYKLRKR